MHKPGRDARAQALSVITKAQAMVKTVGCAFFVTKFKTVNSPLKRIGAMFALASLLVLFSGLLSVFNLQNNTAQAATSDQLNFQGRLLTNTGSLVPDGEYNVEFNLYNVATGGSTQWTETRLSSGTGVTVQNGYYSVYLGDQTAFGSLDWSQDLYLGMTIRGTTSCAWGSCSPADSEMTPRFKLTSVPYAFVSSNVASSNVDAANSDDVSITTGDTTTSGISGNINIDNGAGFTSNGGITLGATNASALTLGRTGVTTTNTGSLTVTELTTLNGGLTVEAGDTFTFNGDAFTDLTGTGLIVSGNALQTTLGIAIDSSEITDWYRHSSWYGY
jgi:hypothetical protein